MAESGHSLPHFVIRCSWLPVRAGESAILSGARHLRAAREEERQDPDRTDFILGRLTGQDAVTLGPRAPRAAAQAEKTAPGDGKPNVPAPTQRRREWARLIAKVLEVNPLRCPCGATMRVVALILDLAVIRKILQHRPGEPAA